MSTDKNDRQKKKDANQSKVGQGFNDARGDFPDHYEVPKNNGLNVNNDPAHQREKERRREAERSH